MTSRLKKIANNVSPFIHKEVEEHIKNNSNVSRWRFQQSQDSFFIAKKLLSELPIVPTNERVHELAQDITIGNFDDISNLDNAELEENWELWVQRTRDLLKSRGILD